MGDCATVCMSAIVCACAFMCVHVCIVFVCVHVYMRVCVCVCVRELWHVSASECKPINMQVQ